MTRNLKALGLALVAALALSVVAASAASAATHHITGTIGDKIEAKADNVQVFENTTGAKNGYECKKVSAVGEVKATTSTSLTAEPKYEECISFGEPAGALVTVTPNGCTFTFEGTTTTGNPTLGEHANVNIVCPAGKEIKIDVTAFKVACAGIPAQLVKHAVRYEEDESAPEKAITVNATAHGIVSKTEGVCGSGEHTNGSYTGKTTVTAPKGLKLTTNAT